MSDESAAETVYEAGLELWNPGGEPDVLRDAAEAWGAMGDALDKFVVRMDKVVREVCGDEWRGPAADAFVKHWEEVKKSVEDAQPSFDEAKKGLNEAADKIEEINSEIHQIYLEIGVTIGVSLATSFITLGFSAAAGAANAARLAGQAAAAAARLGRILATIARWFERLRTFERSGSGLARFGAFVVRHGSTFAGRTAIEFGNGVATSMISGKGPEWENNLVGGIAGAGMGKAADAALGGRLGGGIGESTGTGAIGGATGSLVGDAANSYGWWADKDDEFDWSQSLIGAGTGAAGGSVGGALTHTSGAGEANGTGEGASSGTTDASSTANGTSSGTTDASSTADGASGGTADASGTSGAAGASEGSGDQATPNTGADAEGLTQEQRNAMRDEATSSRVGTLTGAAGNRLKEADSIEDDVAEGQQKTAERLREHANNTSLVDDFG